VAAFLSRRACEAVVTAFLASLLVFAMVAGLPGDPALVLLGDKGTPEQIEALRTYLGTNRPIAVQYARWVARLVRGDLGRSFINGRPVTDTIRRAFPVTLQLAAWALAVVGLIAVPTGLYASTHPRSALASVLAWYHGLALATPIFWFGVIVSTIFGVNLHWLPPSGFIPLVENPLAWVRSMILPGVTLGFGVGSVMARFIQASLEDVLERDYVRTARAKGLRERAVVLGHALRNAMIPVITVLGLQAGFFIGGAVITEAVFAIPGMGSALWRAILVRDYFVTQAIVMIGIAAFIIINFVTDMTYGLLDPRVRFQ
jgi:peptide/nickel transport system permease protein